MEQPKEQFKCKYIYLFFFLCMRSQCMRQSDKTLPHRCAWSPYLQYLTRKRTICKGPDVSTISNYQSVHLPRCKMLSIISVTWARGWLCIACGHKVTGLLTLNPLTWKIWRAPNNARKWQMGFNSAFKGLIHVKPGKLVSFNSLRWPDYCLCIQKRVARWEKHVEKWGDYLWKNAILQTQIWGPRWHSG